MPLRNPRQALATSKFMHDVRQAEGVVHREGGRGLEVRAAHRGVDEQPDPRGVDAGLGERLRPGHRGGVDEPDVVRPPAALGDPGEVGQQTGAQPDPTVRRGEPLVELAGGHDVRSVDPADGQHRRVRVALGRITTHQLPLFRRR